MNGTINYRRYLAGDDEAFIEIVKEYKDGLIIYLNNFTKNIHIAEELAEDTFVKLGIKKPRNTEKSSFKTWLYVIGRNIAIDYLRKKSKSKEIPINDNMIFEQESIEQSYIKEENKLLIHKVMRKLKLEYKQVLWLTYFEGFTNKEIAKIMKKNLHNIETLVYRARLSLKSELEKEGFSYEDL